MGSPDAELVDVELDGSYHLLSSDGRQFEI